MAVRRPDAVAVAVFAKYPTPGLVKTRLTTDYTADEAARIHRLLVADQLQRLQCLPKRMSTTLWGTNAPSAPFYRDLLLRHPGLKFRLQHGHDLGCRMNFAICTSLRHSSRVILLGSDCAQLELSHVLALNKALDHHDLALIGAADGGYVAIALKQPQPVLFRHVTWGTDRVLHKTRSVARRQRLRHCVVDTLHDIDVPTDLHRFPTILERAGVNEPIGAGSP